MRWLAILFLMLTTLETVAAQPLDMQALVESVRAGRASDRQVHRQRLQTFKAQRDEQQQAVQQLAQRKQALEAQIAEMETQFAAQREQLQALDAQRNERMGDLKELYGVIQQQVDDARGQFDVSLTRPQYPERERELTTIAETLSGGLRLANLADIEQIWFELLREMRASSEIAHFDTDVVSLAGETRRQSVIRVGLFNAVSEGRYLKLSADNGRLSVLTRQPGHAALSSAAGLAEPTGRHWFSLDPTRGQLLSLLVHAPDLRERFAQGGIVGYVIVALGSLALLVGLTKLVRLYWLGLQVCRQKRDPQDANDNNPLGRVFGTYQAHAHLSGEALELKIDEAVLRELPPINRWVPLIKIVAAVAPLLGLLGTVLGMILTFQSITLLGTGDPKLMAGGISTALVTTVLGLLVAVPALLIHSVVAAQARRLTQVLEQQALGLIAHQSEQVAPPPVELQAA